MGRTEAKPIVKLDTQRYQPAVLQWLPVTHRGARRGELLAAFELFLVCSMYRFSQIGHKYLEIWYMAQNQM